MQTSTSATRDGPSGTWKIERKAGAGTLVSGDEIYLQSMYGSANYLDVCDGTSCVTGTTYAVQTSSTKQRDGLSGTWTVTKADGSSGNVIFGDELYLKNMYGVGTYLDTCGYATDGGCSSSSYTYVSTNTQSNRGGAHTATWTILPPTGASCTCRLCGQTSICPSGKCNVCGNAVTGSCDASTTGGGCYSTACPASSHCDCAQEVCVQYNAASTLTSAASVTRLSNGSTTTRASRSSYASALVPPELSLQPSMAEDQAAAALTVMSSHEAISEDHMVTAMGCSIDAYVHIVNNLDTDLKAVYWVGKVGSVYLPCQGDRYDSKHSQNGLGVCAWVIKAGTSDDFKAVNSDGGGGICNGAKGYVRPPSKHLPQMHPKTCLLANCHCRPAQFLCCATGPELRAYLHPTPSVPETFDTCAHTPLNALVCRMQVAHVATGEGVQRSHWPLRGACLLQSARRQPRWHLRSAVLIGKLHF